MVLDKVRNEVKSVAKNPQSPFCLKKPKDLRTRKFFAEISEEIETKMPTLLPLINAIATNPNRITRNKYKTQDYINFPILQAISLLLKSHNMFVNSVAKMNSVVLLRRGGLNKSGFKRMVRSGFAFSYSNTLNL